MLIVNYDKILLCCLLIWRATPLHFNSPLMLAIDFYQQICLGAKVHIVFFAFPFVDDVLHFDFGVARSEKNGGIGMINFSLFDHVVTDLSVFSSVMLDIYPKLILIPQYFDNGYLIWIFVHFLHYFIESVINLNLFFNFVHQQVSLKFFLSSLDLLLLIQYLRGLLMPFGDFFMLVLRFFMLFFDLFDLLMSLKFDSLHHQLSLEWKQLLHKSWLS